MSDRFPEDPHKTNRSDLIRKSRSSSKHYKDGGEKLQLGLHSHDPDNDEHNWPDYTDYENGDECNICRTCNIDFFGFSQRINCYKCSMEGTTKVEEIKQ